jgi:hypothetical protein
MKYYLDDKLHRRTVNGNCIELVTTDLKYITRVHPSFIWTLEQMGYEKIKQEITPDFTCWGINVYIRSHDNMIPIIPIR